DKGRFRHQRVGRTRANRTGVIAATGALRKLPGLAHRIVFSGRRHSSRHWGSWLHRLRAHLKTGGSGTRHRDGSGGGRRGRFGPLL
ncbi:hypothetical protein C1X98_31190, partial [Pseudomonas sp. FW306-2-11BA]|uniref:hypothetical protein n=1 Tax=Pseudomonas sp. FW306-2-11BA TaxID=2070662 RepID=UPI000CC66163